MSLLTKPNKFAVEPKKPQSERISESLKNISSSTFIYPGTFDPFTLGHKDIAERAARMCKKLVIAVSDSRKGTMFSQATRVEIAKKSVANIGDNIEVLPFSGLLPTFAEKLNVQFVVRGVRNNQDYENEAFLMRNYKTFNPNLEMIILPSAAEFLHISSTIVRELVLNRAPLNGYVAEEAVDAMNIEQVPLPIKRNNNKTKQ